MYRWAPEALWEPVMNVMRKPGLDELQAVRLVRMKLDDRKENVHNDIFFNIKTKQRGATFKSLPMSFCYDMILRTEMWKPYTV
jgi:hypothetical protein